MNVIFVIAVIVAILDNIEALHNPKVEIFEIRGRPESLNGRNAPGPYLKKLHRLPSSRSDTEELARYFVNQVDTTLYHSSSSESESHEEPKAPVAFVDKTRNIDVLPLSTDYTDYVVQRFSDNKIQGKNRFYKLSSLLKERSGGDDLKRKRRDVKYDRRQWDVPCAFCKI